MRRAYFLSVLLMTTTLVCFTACSRKASVETGKEDKQEIITTVETEEVVEFLNFLADPCEEKDTLTTVQGVTFSCLSPYNMWAEATPDINGNIEIAAFCLEQEYVQESYYSDEKMKLDFELSSNAKIVGIQYLNYEKQVIATKKISNKVVIIPDVYEDVYVDKVVIFVEYNGKIYQTVFERTGA